MERQQNQPNEDNNNNNDVSSSDATEIPAQQPQKTRGKVGVGAAELNGWYEANLAHPYPDSQTLHSLAEQTGLTVAQVRKWLANRRMRRSNTRSLNELARMRRDSLVAGDTGGVKVNDVGGGDRDENLVKVKVEDSEMAVVNDNNNEVKVNGGNVDCNEN